MAKKSPDATDIHVGKRVRALRMTKGVSQETLGDCLGLTFQQVQKYEKGTNRIAPSRLQAIAGFLDVPVSYFFDGGPASNGDAGPQRSDLATELLLTRDGAELARAFLSLPAGGVRHAIVRLVKELAGETVTDAAPALNS